MAEVNIYNENPLQIIYYQVWVAPDGKHWYLQDGCDSLRHKPMITKPSYKTKVIEVVQSSRVLEEIEAC